MRDIIETEAEPVDMESWKSQIQTTKEVTQWLEQRLGSFEGVVVADCLQQRIYLRQKMYCLGAPKSTNEEG